MPFCHGSDSSESDKGSIPNESLASIYGDGKFQGSVKGWKDVKEMRADVDSYETTHDGLSSDYVAHIKQRIEATANVGVANGGQVTPEKRDQIENALRILWKCRNDLGTARAIIDVIIWYINDKQSTLKEEADQGNSIAQALQKAKINPVNGQKNMNDLMDAIESEASKLAQTLYGNNDKDFTDLAIFVAFLHDNLKQYNLYHDFASVLDSILEFYESTKNNGIKEIIEEELKKIPRDGKEIGPCGDEIKEFPRSLRRILGL
jgi:hypothetical protein